MALTDAMASELFTRLRFGNFLGISGMVVTQGLGLAWGAPFYGIWVLHGAHLLLRWRRYMRLPAEAG
jgi:hypothetical protein